MGKSNGEQRSAAAGNLQDRIKWLPGNLKKEKDVK
jgi:hypothetical protein